MMRGDPWWRRQVALEAAGFVIIIGSIALAQTGTFGSYVGLLIIVLVLGYMVLSEMRR
jgi:hypothetical protein